MIIEQILTTMDVDGNVNFAPMGVEWGDEEIIIKPYKETTTYPNLKATGVAVVNITDNVLYIARGAISKPQFPWHAAHIVKGAVIEDACSWREVEVRGVDESQDRTRFTTRVVHRGFKREFVGFNRARHAVLEAAILATRIRFLRRNHIVSEFERLQIIVDKTAGSREHEAMQLLTDYVRKAAS